MAIVLPLGVVAHQLIKIEADLRLLNMKALELAKERENGRHTRLIEATLENINEALDAIKGLVSDIETDIQPRSMNRKTYPERDD
jgi:tetrahydromethanopterin S-methyltransferase subunit B